MKKVQILMSTYNGYSYLKTQLESIIQQKYYPIELLIRDDGSVDGTQKILKEYSTNFPWIHWYQGKNIGVQKSFFDLIQKADSNACYTAFADQDDKWMPEKLIHAIEKIQELESSQKPILYCSDKNIVDENLIPIPVTVSRIVNHINFGNAVVQNICTGCTAVINQELLKLLQKYLPTKIDSIIMHDWWLYLTATCFGTVYYDINPYIYYRQHNKNTSGAMLNRRKLLLYRIQQLTKTRGHIYRQLEEFKQSFEIDNEKIQILEKVLKSEHSIKGRIYLALDRNIFRQKKSDDLVYRIIILIGKL